MPKQSEPRFLDRLRVVQLEGKWYRLIHRVRYRSEVLGREVVIPNGFVTDFDSIRRLPPIIFWFLSANTDRPPVLHDYLYRMEEDTREQCDRAYLEAMGSEGYSMVKRRLKYWGVWIGGLNAYGKNKGQLDPR